MLEKEAEGENADVSKDSQQKRLFTVLNPSIAYGACLPHKAAVSIYEINYAACLGRGQHPDVSFSFGFSQQCLF